MPFMILPYHEPLGFHAVHGRGNRAGRQFHLLADDVHRQGPLMQQGLQDAEIRIPEAYVLLALISFREHGAISLPQNQEYVSCFALLSRLGANGHG